MRRAAILLLGVIAAGAVAGACSSGSSTSSSSLNITTSSSAFDVTTTPSTVASEPTTAVAAADCQKRISEVKTAITNGLNSMDVNPKAESAAGKSIFTAFARMNVACHAQASTALSDVIQFLSTQTTGRKPPTQQGVNMALTAFCKAVPQDVTLTPEAQATCAAHH